MVSKLRDSLLKIFIREKTPKCLPAGHFFCMSYMKCLLKCFYSKKPPLAQKIPGCAPVKG